MWAVRVNNIGLVCAGHDEHKARETARVYAVRALLGYGRAAHEDVSLWRDDALVEEYLPDAPYPAVLAWALEELGHDGWEVRGTRVAKGAHTIHRLQHCYRWECLGLEVEASSLQHLIDEADDVLRTRSNQLSEALSGLQENT